MGPQHTSIRKARALLGTTPFLGSNNVPQGEETMDSGQMDYLIHLLPQFTHHVVRVSPARSIYDLRHGEGVCAVGILVTPERQSFALFTARHMVLPSFRVMVPRERLSAWAPMLTPKGEIDLEKVGLSLVGGYLLGIFFQNRRIDDLRNCINRRFDDFRDLLKSEVKRLEERFDHMDERLERLEHPIVHQS